MGSVITCFFLEPHNEVEQSLRRFVFSKDAVCVGHKGYHDASVTIGVLPWSDPDSHGSGDDDFDHADPRWPKTCECGYVFQPDDHWQHNLTLLYIRKDTGEKTTLSGAAPGAMWYADWFPDEEKRAPDGRVLIVKTPAGDWNVDSKANNGPGWTRTGTPPKVTATPSIGMGRRPDGQYAYHGWLRDGTLVEC